MNLTTDMSILTLIAEASWVVKGVIGLLLLASVASWALIFQKVLLFRSERRAAERFEQEFWGEGRAVIFQREQENKAACCSMESVFQAGHYAFRGLRNQAGATAETRVESARRAMRAAYQREMDALESHLSFLATIGSVSPYIGLFGTVWGIMNAFRGLSNVAQATLAHVAPGIAEALVATAIGLFAAIPAVIAYNHFTHELDRLANRFDVFMEELSNILQRDSHRS